METKMVHQSRDKCASNFYFAVSADKVITNIFFQIGHQDNRESFSVSVKLKDRGEIGNRHHCLRQCRKRDITVRGKIT